jgi:hypothetical protein
MSAFPGSPCVLKGGIVLIDPENASSPPRVITLQYNSDSLTRTLVPKTVKESGDRSEALRLTGPPVETIKLEAEIDATDQIEVAETNSTVTQFGIFPQLCALEALVYPSSIHLNDNDVLAGRGILEIAPMQSALTLFVWSAQRIVPVRLTDFSITEEAFDAKLNPIRAKVSLGMRVLSVDDFGFNSKGANLFMSYLRQKERLATQIPPSALCSLGVPQANL